MLLYVNKYKFFKVASEGNYVYFLSLDSDNLQIRYVLIENIYIYNLIGKKL